MGGPKIINCSMVGGSDPIAPAPDPRNWTLLGFYQYDHAYVMRLKYHGCTNYEGVKILVYRGQNSNPLRRDPHFADDALSPMARFEPTPEGWHLACKFAETYQPDL